MVSTIQMGHYVYKEWGIGNFCSFFWFPIGPHTSLFEPHPVIQYRWSDQLLKYKVLMLKIFHLKFSLLPLPNKIEARLKCLKVPCKSHVINVTIIIYCITYRAFGCHTSPVFVVYGWTQVTFMPVLPISWSSSAKEWLNPVAPNLDAQ